MVKIKLNKKQQEKFDLIKKFITDNEHGKKYGLYLDDQDETLVSVITNIFINASGLKVAGQRYAGHMKSNYTDTIYPDQITKIYNAGKRGDEEFIEFLQSVQENKAS